MGGSTPFLIDTSENFKRYFKKLAKIHDSSFVETVGEILEVLIEDPYPINSRNEPLTGKIHLLEGWPFHKLEFRVSRGASGQIRLMYLVNSVACLIKLIWIYNHEQFTKRPADKDIQRLIKEILEG